MFGAIALFVPGRARRRKLYRENFQPSTRTQRSASAELDREHTLLAVGVPFKFLQRRFNFRAERGWSLGQRR